MAVGDVKSGLQSVAAGSFLDIQPAGADEWVVHNIYHESDVELYLCDGTNQLLFDSASGNGVYAKTVFHVTGTIRLRAKNTAASAKLMGFDGVQTK